MSTAYINPFAGLDDGSGAHRGTAQCFQGDCSDDVVELTLTDEMPEEAQYTVPGAGVGYLAIYLSAPGQIYAGPSEADKESKGAYYPAGWWPMAVKAGDVVFIRDL